MSAYQRAAQVLVLLFEQSWDAEAIDRKVQRIRALLSRAEVAGLTHYDSMEAAEDSSGRSVMTVLLFEHPSCALFRLPMTDQSDEQVGTELGERVSALEDVRCVMTFFSQQRRDIESILSQAQRRMKGVPVLGASAGMREMFLTDAGESYVFDGQCCASNQDAPELLKATAAYRKLLLPDIAIKVVGLVLALTLYPPVMMYSVLTAAVYILSRRAVSDRNTQREIMGREQAGFSQFNFM